MKHEEASLSSLISRFRTHTQQRASKLRWRKESLNPNYDGQTKPEVVA